MEANILFRIFSPLMIFIFTHHWSFGNCSCRKSLVNKQDFSNTLVTELSLWSKSGVESARDCASHCGRDNKCVSIFFNPLSTVCTAHSVQFYPSQPTTPDEGSLYYTLSVDKRDCDDILKNYPSAPDGVYVINLGVGFGHFRVYCDMTGDGGGWTVFQRRRDNTVNFNQNWITYKNGFGIIGGEFWLGNDIISKLSNQKPSQLRIDMRDQAGESGYATYSNFRVHNEAANYKLTATGFVGDRGDSLEIHHGQAFSTYDMDNDETAIRNCAAIYGAWWMRNCFNSNLNGKYGENDHDKGIHWLSWHGFSLTWTQMKMKPA